MVKFLKCNIFPIILVLVSLFVCSRNYTPGTFLTGWDTLHPEFNYRIYWSRILDGAWQEHQGLGAVASQAHAAEIPRVLILMLFDLFLPTRGVRYAYAFLMLILGPLGVFFFVKKGLFSEKKSVLIDAAALCAGLFYLLNLVTVQHFYIPLEMFLTHYGYLGFFMLGVLKLLREQSKRNSFYFILVSFFMAPQAHTSTLFYALLANLFGFFAIYWIFSKFAIHVLKNFLRIFALVMIVNAFWLLPNLYFASNHGSEVQESKIHSLFNQEAFLQNKAFGNIKDIALGRGFLFNWGEHKGNFEFGYLLDDWQLYQTKPYILPLGYALFACALVGVVFFALAKRKEAFSVIGMLLVSMFFLFNVNPPTGVIYNFLQENIPLFGDAFRFPFTKFSISLVFSYAVFFGGFIYGVLLVLSKLFKKSSGNAMKVFAVVSVLVSFLLLSLWMAPVYKGGLISPSMRISIPERYFKLFDYLDKQDGFGRVANLPIHTFWGWVYYNWDEATKLGYQGAGFLWFGIKQPLMDREFDRWNIINQEYYKDMTQAVYSQDLGLLEDTLEKYKIRWILHDEKIIAPGDDQKILYIQEIEELLNSSQNIMLAEDFGGGLLLYEYLPGRPFELKEYASGSEVNQKDSYIFRVVEGFNEEISPESIHSSQNTLTFSSQIGSEVFLSSSEKVYLPFDVLAKSQSDGLWLKFEDSVYRDTISFEAKLSENFLENGVLNIEGNIVELSGLTAEYRKISHLYLPLYRPINASVYQTDAENNRYDISSISAQLEVCSDVDRFSSYSISRSPQGFSLSSKNADACFTADLLELLPDLEIPKDSLLKLQVTGDFQVEPCIFNQETSLCENYPLSKGVSYLVTREYIGNYNLRFYTRTLGHLIEAKQTYDSISLSFQKPLVSSPIEIPDYVLAEALERPLSGSFDFPKALGFGGPAGTLFSNARYCKSGERYGADTPFGDSRFYKTDNQEICDTFAFPLAKHSLGQVLEIRARNISGIPLRICLTNEYSKRCDKYIELPEDPLMKAHFYLVPPMGEQNNGYVVNMSNLAFAGDPSENELGYIGLTQIPYNFLMNIEAKNKLADEDRVLVFNQSFEKGWLALCGLKSCGAKHIMVDGWANGWVFKNGIPAQVRIVFWPQILEYFGILLLAGIFAIKPRRFL